MEARALVDGFGFESRCQIYRHSLSLTASAMLPVTTARLAATPAVWAAWHEDSTCDQASAAFDDVFKMLLSLGINPAGPKPTCFENLMAGVWYDLYDFKDKKIKQY